MLLVTETNHVCPCVINSKIVTWLSPDFHSVASFSPSHVTTSILQSPSQWIKTFCFACKKPYKDIRRIAHFKNYHHLHFLLLCVSFYQNSRVPAHSLLLHATTHPHIPWESNPFPLTENTKYTREVFVTHWTTLTHPFVFFTPGKKLRTQYNYLYRAITLDLALKMKRWINKTQTNR